MFNQKKSQTNDVAKRNWHISLPLVNKILVVLIIVLSVSYIASINNLSIKGFVLNDNKAKINELTKEKSDIELKVAQFESNDSLNNRAQQLAMVKVDKINYLTVVGGKVARR
jgi:hypothetical protein